MAIDVEALFSGVELFRGLPGEVIADLGRRGNVRTLAPRTILIRQGDAADTVFLVHRGQIRLSQLTRSGDQVVVSFVTPGELFAVAAAMQTTTYPVTAEAVRETLVVEWHRAVLADLFRRHPERSFKAVQVISARMRELQERFRDLATLPVPQRLARALLRIAERCGRPTDEGIHLDLQLGRQDLAELTGTTLFTASRVLSGWRESGIVTTGRERVTIRQIEQLRAVAETVVES